MERDKDLIKTVKDKLNSKNDNVLELYKELKQRMISVHPDKYVDRKAKEHAENEFKELHNLYDRLGSYIQQQLADNVPILKSESGEIAEFFNIQKENIQEDEIERLKKENEILKFRISNLEGEKEVLDKQIEELKNKKIQTIHDEIKEIYTPRKAWKAIGIISVITSLLSLFPVIKRLAEEIGVDSILILFLIQSIAIITLLNWVRIAIINKVIESIEYKVLNSANINMVFNIRKLQSKYNSCFYFDEKDVMSYIRSKIKGIVSILFWGTKEKIIKILTDDIIIQFDKKKLIKDTKSDGLMKLFIVDKTEEVTSTEESSIPF